MMFLSNTRLIKRCLLTKNSLNNILNTKLIKISSLSSSTSSSINEPHYHIAIVGSGPAGFYTTKYLLDKNPNIHIDIIEKLPTPYGLVRFGVAPDHQDVKSVISQFYEIANDPRVRFFGNVSIALKDEDNNNNNNNNNVSTNNVIELEELRKKYSAVVLSYGASSDIPLGIENEDLDGILSARTFVNWYNGHPDNVNIGNEINLNKVKDVVIIGHGNVAIDCARILAKTTNELAITDITSESLSKLDKSSVKHITLLGRRGHVQSSFTIKEVRELSKLSQADLLISKKELESGSTEQSLEEIKLHRPKKRIIELLHTISKDIPVLEEDNILHPVLINSLKDNNKKQIDLRFLLSPTKFISDSNGRVSGIEVEKNQLIGDVNQQKAKGTGEKFIIPCQLVLKAVGYRSLPIKNVPFDYKTYTIFNDKGRIEINDNRGLYTVGWLKRGPNGIIGTNITCARETVATILEDIDNNKIIKQINIPNLFSSLDTVITWENYQTIENEETQRGKTSYPIRPREKITDINTLIKIGKKV